MRRRDFIAAVGLAPAMWPFPARAQRPPAIPLIGYLDSSGLPPWYAAFERGLNDLGYVQGRTIAIEHRSAAGQAERLPALAAELVSLQPKVIVTSGSPAAVAASKVTATIPIVFTFATDPVGLGLVASLARPGGNITGQSNQGPGLVGKRLQVLAEMVPGASRFSVVWTPSFAANHADFGEMQKAAATLGLVLQSLEVTRPSDFDAAFKEAAARTSGVAVLSGPLIFAHREPVVAAAARHKVPAIYYDAEYAEAGGLLSYGPSLVGLHRSAAVFVDRILKGERPADLPVEQPTRFKLVVNMKTAKALGLTVPPALLVRADDVIE
jgi:putative tryptophan/tyrosine transport system substrate-binding protein